jgi:spore maturation protein CgeB
VADVYNGLIKGLRECGCDVGILNLDDRIEYYSRAEVPRPDGTYTQALELRAAMEMAAQGIEVSCYEWWPDVVIVVSGFFVPPKVWRVLSMRPHHVVYWCTESPYEDDKQAEPARFADTVVLNDPTNLEQFQDEVNANTHYFPHSYDPAIHHPGPVTPVFRSDFAFVGTGFPSRIDWLNQVDFTGINAKLAGNWQALDDDSPLLPMLIHGKDQCMDNKVTANVYRSTKVSLNLYRKEHSEDAHANGWAMGPREVELAACGTFFIREPRGEGDTVFPMLPIVASPAEFNEQLRWWLSHDKQREQAAESARASIVDRTFKNTAARLLRLVEASRRQVAA